jgi:hypothetical protein
LTSGEAQSNTRQALIKASDIRLHGTFGVSSLIGGFRSYGGCGSSGVKRWSAILRPQRIADDKDRYRESRKHGDASKSKSVCHKVSVALFVLSQIVFSGCYCSAVIVPPVVPAPPAACLH